MTEFIPHIGTDESGKGDFFGPLVIAGVLVDEKNAEKFTAKIEKQTQELVNKNLETAIRRELIDFKMNPKKIEIFTDKNEDNCIVMIRCKIYTNRSELISAENAKNMIEKNLGICTEFIEV